MRNNFPMVSQEINDKLLSSYENLTYLLGQKLPNEEVYSGVFDILENSCSGYITSPSGIPNIAQDKILDILKFDYIYRKHYGQIKGIK